MAAAPELVAYLRKEVEKGITEAQLRPFLKSKGYTDQSLDEAFAELAGRPLPVRPESPAAMTPDKHEGPAASARSGKMSKKAVAAFIVALLPYLSGILFPLASGTLFLTAFWVLPAMGVIGLLCPVIGLILGIGAVKRVKRLGERGKAFAIIAIVLAGLSLLLIILGVIGVLLLGMALFSVGNTVEDAGSVMEEAGELRAIGENATCRDAGGSCLDPSQVRENATTCADLGYSSLAAYDGTCPEGGVCCEA
ncbi:DUF4190 domain-containing protein [Candidatus Woesearchaeota archaeon]|nr:DUF4190 domain-containing protein [Candidatus Woesearchaeota archaeon]